MVPFRKRRVVITGIGIVSPIGTGKEKNWLNCIEGKSGIGKITKFDASAFRTTIAGETKNFDPSKFLDPKEVDKFDPFIHYALASAVLAIEDSKLAMDRENPERVGVYIGSGIGGLSTIEKTYNIILNHGPRRISPYLIPGLIINMASGLVSIIFGAKGPNSSTATACATSAHSIGDSFRIIQRGEADIMISGGAEAPITPTSLGGFCALRALSMRNDEPEKASRPFDLNRDGFVMGEGAGVIILEELEHALSRNANIYAEIVGYGMSGDAFHVTAPCSDGDGAVRCMKLAIEDAGIKPEDIDYINAHGTSTPLNDKIETIAIKKLFGSHAYKLAISSTKSMTGHLLGAAGAVETIFTTLAIKEGIVPPTINYEFPDPECDLDYVPNKARKMEIKYAMNNSFGFGGTNASLVLKRFED